MNKIPDFTRLISSPPFTFLVGKDHTKLTIQSGLAKHVSRPLDDLMNNGHTRESKHRIAVLEDEEVEVFTAFTQYAYTGNYTVPVVQQKSELQLPLPPAPVAPAVPAAELSPASSGRRSGSGSARSAGSGGTILDGGRNNSSSSNNQQLLQLQHDNIPIRTQSSASFLPPPAPTPPPFDRQDSQGGRRYVETPLALTAAADEWENPFAHAAEPSSFREDTPPVEVIKNENDVHDEEEAAAAAEDETDRPLFPLSKRHGKKDKKKNKRKGAAAAPAFEETVPKSLTPPSTPPFDVREIKAETPPLRRENRLEIEQQSHDYDADCAIETDPGEPDEAIGDEDGDWWDQPVSPGRRRERGREQDREYEDRMPNGRRPLHQPQPQPQQQREMPLIDTSFATTTTSQRISATPRKKGGNTWNEFASLDYFHQQHDEQHDHHSDVATTPKPAPAVAQTTIIIVPYILFHAKVYVFATRFLIPGLAQLCLQKLHTSLLDYPLTPVSDDDDETNSNSPKNINDSIESLKFSAHAKMFLDILRYTYENTTRFEPESPTAATQLRECELRKLVAQYASIKMRELAVYTPATIPRVPSSPSHGPGSGVSVITAPGGGLRELLDRIPELASDLVFLMM